MTLELLARLGGLAAWGGLALVVLGRPRPARLAGLALWAIGLALFVPLLAPSGQTGAVAAGAVGVAVLGTGVAFLLRRVPWALPFLALAAVPARVPVEVGDESASLLVPLYVVVAGAAVALGWSLWRDRGPIRELGPISWPLVLFVAWASSSAFWADDPTEASIDLFFFLLPFGLLAVAVARLPWRDEAPAWLLRLLVAMALLFAAVGIWQWVTREIFWNEKVVRGNENSVFFRVNSLFWDPSIYGRFLMLAILALLIVLVFGRLRTRLPFVGAALAILWVGLLFSFSQSSFAALLSGLALLVLLAWRARGAQALAALMLLAILVFFLAPPLERAREKLTDPSSESVNRATRGRSDLITKGLRIAGSSPVVGVGIGNFASEYEERFDPPGRLRTPSSHTTPVTVLAETGAVGLALFAWLVFAVGRLAFGTGRGGRDPLRLTALAAAFGLTAIFVHALFYSAFLEDPMTWGLIGLAALTGRAFGSAGERDAVGSDSQPDRASVAP